MTGGIGAVRYIRFDGYMGPRLSRQEQLKRLQRVIYGELTQLQRETVIAYYFQERSIPQIAEDRGVNKRTVSRTLKRAEERMRRCLRY